MDNQRSRFQRWIRPSILRLRSSSKSSENVFLFLDAEEPADMVERFCLVPFSLESEVRQYIYSPTAGLAGCVRSLLIVLQNSSVDMYAHRELHWLIWLSRISATPSEPSTYSTY